MDQRLLAECIKLNVCETYWWGIAKLPWEVIPHFPHCLGLVIILSDNHLPAVYDITLFLFMLPLLSYLLAWEMQI